MIDAAQVAAERSDDGDEWFEDVDPVGNPTWTHRLTGRRDARHNTDISPGDPNVLSQLDRTTYCRCYHLAVSIQNASASVPVSGECFEAYSVPSPLQVGYSGVMTCADLRTASSCTGAYCADGYQGTVAYADGDHPGDNVKLSGCQLIEHFCKGDPSTGACLSSRLPPLPCVRACQTLTVDGVLRCGFVHCSGDLVLGQQRHQYISARVVRRYSRQQRVSPERYVYYPQQCIGERRHECLLRHGNRWRRLDAGPAD
jgi:hypothetical protein